MDTTTANLKELAEGLARAADRIAELEEQRLSLFETLDDLVRAVEAARTIDPTWVSNDGGKGSRHARYKLDSAVDLALHELADVRLVLDAEEREALLPPPPTALEAPERSRKAG